MRKPVILLSGKNKDVKFAMDFMRNWFGGDTKLSEASEREVEKVYHHLYRGEDRKMTSGEQI